jgi:hypothetical protein
MSRSRVSGYALLALVVLGGCGVFGGCGAKPPATQAPPTSAVQQGERDQLAGLAAAAKDKRYVARYTLTAPKRGDRTVTVAVATDGSWVVAVPAGALGGLADVAIYGSSAGLYQCALGPAVGTSGARPDLGPVTAGCVRVGRLSASVDPRVEHVFTDWIDPLVDRATALSVASAAPLPGVHGSCFSVESNSAALAPPVDPGIYCYQSDGVLAGARVGFGTLTLDGPVAPAPPTVVMPAPVVSRAPLPIVAPPAPPPPTPSATARHAAAGP